MVDHVQVFERIIKEIDHGNGKRYMAILKDSMSGAPASLLAIATEMSGKDILAGADIGLVELTKRQRILKTKTYLVFAFKDSEEEMSHNAARAFAKRARMRLLDKEEAEWFRTKFKKLPQWKRSLNSHWWYWTSCVSFGDRNVAWSFRGSDSFVHDFHRDYDNGVRCVGRLTCL